MSSQLTTTIRNSFQSNYSDLIDVFRKSSQQSSAFLGCFTCAEHLNEAHYANPHYPGFSVIEQELDPNTGLYIIFVDGIRCDQCNSRIAQSVSDGRQS
jgi:hypothetical protein